MSTNLHLVFDHYRNSRWLLGYERLRLEWQDREAFDKIRADAVPTPYGVEWYGDEGLENHKNDEYGEPLTFLAAHSLARHLSSASLGPWDVAVLAFVKALPPDTPVVLWWC